MVRANFKGANLRQANLAGANATNANFGGAILGGACLVDTDLSGARLGGANAGTAIFRRTTMPDGETINNSGCNRGTVCCPLSGTCGPTQRRSPPRASHARRGARSKRS